MALRRIRLIGDPAIGVGIGDQDCFPPMEVDCPLPQAVELVYRGRAVYVDDDPPPLAGVTGMTVEHADPAPTVRDPVSRPKRKRR